MPSFIQSGRSFRKGATEVIVANAKSWNEFAAVALNAFVAGMVQFCAVDTTAGVDVAAEADKMVWRRASSLNASPGGLKERDWMWQRGGA